MSSPSFIQAHVNRKIMAKRNKKKKKLTTWLEGVCLGARRWRRGGGGCFAGMVPGRKQAAVFIAAHF